MRKLVIGNKNYSSWSFRGWLALRWAGIRFEEEVIPLRQAGSPEAKASRSPTGLVPALHLDDEIVIWDSLAIGEWAHEQSGTLWPEDPTARAVARSASAEMHSGFQNLRNAMPMNIRRRVEGFVPAADTKREIATIEDRWASLRSRYDSGSGFLCGQRSLADVLYAPIVTRFVTYGIAVRDESRDYMDVLLRDAEVRSWSQAALNEEWSISQYDL